MSSLSGPSDPARRGPDQAERCSGNPRRIGLDGWHHPFPVAEYGWDRLGERINIHCFNYEPSINSSLKFLSKTDWPRAKVERLYLDSLSFDKRKRKNAPADEVRDMGSVWDGARRSE